MEVWIWLVAATKNPDGPTFKTYPGGKLDEKSTTEATKSLLNKGADVKVYVTPDA